MKLGVCIPYRNREAHLKEFIPRVGKFLEERGIDYCMYFAHQVDGISNCEFKVHNYVRIKNQTHVNVGI